MGTSLSWGSPEKSSALVWTRKGFFKKTGQQTFQTASQFLLNFIPLPPNVTLSSFILKKYCFRPEMSQAYSRKLILSENGLVGQFSLAPFILCFTRLGTCR